MEGSKRMMKRPVEEVYDQMLLKVLTKGKKETEEHYRSIFRLVKEQTQSESEWNEASRKVKSIYAQIDLLDVIIKAENFDFVAELEKLTAEHIEAEGNLADVKVKVPDWTKLGESWMMDD
ncbi:hypothetical protein Bca52824_016255 [Brassica carinata]|uniref:Uncharacterized protein n=1 Tax=Brassica carinata TaxID=52824 RepID=A0A8X7W4S2_BRACI|nr:hypothetical protein Bca52824_016255 [Brassica carinata]